LAIDGETLQLTIDDVEISSEDIPGWSVASEGKTTVALDITISEDLRLEGIARDLVNRIQNLRKDQGLDVQDKIDVLVLTNETIINEALSTNKTYICEETQALSLEFVDKLDGADTVEIDDWQIDLSISVR